MAGLLGWILRPQRQRHQVDGRAVCAAQEPWHRAAAAWLADPDPVDQPLLTAQAPSMVLAEPFQGVAMALGQVAAGTGRHKVFAGGDATTGQRANVIERVGIGTAISATVTPVVEYSATELGLAFSFCHQQRSVDVVINHAVLVIPANPRAALTDAQMNKPFRCSVANAVWPFLIAPVLNDLD